MLGRLLKKGSRAAVEDEDLLERGDQERPESLGLLSSDGYITMLEKNPSTVGSERVRGGAMPSFGKEAVAIHPTEVEFKVPQSYQPGQAFPVQGPHGLIDIFLPPEAEAGKTFRYRLKAAPEFLVTVPPDCGPGASVTFERSTDLARISIAVPPGLKAGDQFEVTPPAMMILTPEGVQPGDFVLFRGEVPGGRNGETDLFRAQVPATLLLGRYFAARLPQPDMPKSPTKSATSSPSRAKRLVRDAMAAVE